MDFYNNIKEKICPCIKRGGVNVGFKAQNVECSLFYSAYELRDCKMCGKWCCSECCTSSSDYNFADQTKFQFPFKFIRPGSAGQVNGSLEDFVGMSSKSLLGSLRDVGDQMRLLQYLLTKKKIDEMYFMELTKTMLKSKIENQSMSALPETIVEFLMYIGDVIGRGTEMIRTIMIEIGNMMLSGVGSLLMNIGMNALYGTFVERFGAWLGICAKGAAVVLCSLIRYMADYTLGSIVFETFVQMIASGVAQDVMSVIVTHFQDAVTGKGVKDEGVLDDWTPTFLSLITITGYAFSGKKQVTLANAATISRLVATIVPRNLGDYATFLPFIGDLLTKNSLDLAIEAHGPLWELIKFNMDADQKDESESVDLMKMYRTWCLYREAIDHMKRREKEPGVVFLNKHYGKYIRKPDCIMNTSGAPRVRPHTIVLQGVSAQGKTHLAEQLCETFGNFLIDVFPDYKGLTYTRSQFVYEHTGTEKYWSKFNYQPIILFSDFMSEKSVAGANNAANDFLRAVDTAPMRVDGAAVEDKGKYISPILVIVTTNVHIAQWEAAASPAMNNPKALLTRVDSYYEVTAKRVGPNGAIIADLHTDENYVIYKYFSADGNMFTKKVEVSLKHVVLSGMAGILEHKQKSVKKPLRELKSYMDELKTDPDKLVDLLREENEKLAEQCVDVGIGQQKTTSRPKVRGIRYKKEQKREDVDSQRSGPIVEEERPPSLVRDEAWGLFGSSSAPENDDETGVLPDEERSFELHSLTDEEEEVLYQPEAKKTGVGMFHGVIIVLRSMLGKATFSCYEDYWTQASETEADFCTPSRVHHGACIKHEYCEDPYSCAVAAQGFVRKGYWRSSGVIKGDYVRRYDVVVKDAVTTCLAVGLAFASYALYRKAKRHEVREADSIKELKVGEKIYMRKKFKKEDGSKVYYYVCGDETIPNIVKTKNDASRDVLSRYLPTRVTEKLPKIDANLWEVTTDETVWNKCLAVNESKILMFGHYFGKVETSLRFKKKDVQVNVDKKYMSWKYFEDTDLLIVTIVGGRRLSCKDISVYFPKKEIEVSSMYVKRLSGDTIHTALKSCPITVNGVTRRGLWRVDVKGGLGTCGTPYVRVEDTDEVIVGVHSAGSHSESYYVPVTYEMISDVNNQGITITQPYTIETENGILDEYKNFYKLGESEYVSYPAEKSCYEPVKELWRDKNDLWKKEYGLAKLERFIVDGKEIDPLRVRLKKLDNAIDYKIEHPFLLDSDRVFRAMCSIITAMKRDSGLNFDRMMDYKDVIKDHPEIKWKGMDPSRAAGPMLGGIKRQLLDENGELKFEVYNILREIEQSIIVRRELPVIIRGYQLKDEKLPLEKVQAGNSRIFAPDDAFNYLMNKKFLQNIISMFNLSGKKYGMVLGCTPEEVASVFSTVFKGRTQGIDADVSGIECGHSDETMVYFMNVMLATGVIPNYNKMHDVHPRLPKLDHVGLMIWVCLMITLHGTCVVNKVTFTVPAGMLASGAIITLILNIFGCLLGVVNSFDNKGILADKIGEMLDGKPFAMLYGDDVNIADDEPDYFVRGFKQLGYKLTGADKGIPRVKPIDELSFCSRSFASVEGYGVTMKLDVPKIVKSVQFVKKGKMLQVYPDQVYCFLLEACRHPSYVWNTLVQSVELEGVKLGDYIGDQETYLNKVFGVGDEIYRADICEVQRWFAQVVNKQVGVRDEGNETDKGVDPEGWVDTTQVGIDSGETAVMETGNVLSGYFTSFQKEVSRPIIESITPFTTLDITGQMLYRVNLPGKIFELSDNALMKLANHGFLETDIRIRLETQSNPMQQGALILCGGVCGREPENIFQAISITHGVLDIGKHEAVELLMSYNRVERASTIRAMGTPSQGKWFDYLSIYVMVLSPLLNVDAGNVGLTLTYQLVNPRWSASGYVPLAINEGNRPKVKVFAKKSKKTKEEVGSLESSSVVGSDMKIIDDKIESVDQYGKKSIPEEIAQKVANTLKTVAGAVVTVSSIVSTGLEIASMIGLSKPSIQPEMTLTYDNPHQFSPNVDGVYPGAMLAVHSDAKTILHPVFTGHGDPMAIEEIGKRPGSLGVYTWLAAENVGAVLVAIPITPTVSAGLNTEKYNTPASYISMMFRRYFFKSMFVKITIHGTKFHAGKLEVLANYASVNYITTNGDSATCHRAEWDIAQCSELVVRLDYVSPYNVSVVEDTNVFGDFYNTLVIRTMTKLNAPSVVADRVTMHVTCWFEGLELGVPGFNIAATRQEWVIPEGNTLDLNHSIEDGFVHLGVGTPDYPTKWDRFCAGDRVVSLREVVKRTFGPYDGSVTGVKVSPSWLMKRDAYLSRILDLFVFQSGGWRIRFLRGNVKGYIVLDDAPLGVTNYHGYAKYPVDNWLDHPDDTCIQIPNLEPGGFFVIEDEVQTFTLRSVNMSNPYYTAWFSLGDDVNLFGYNTVKSTPGTTWNLYTPHDITYVPKPLLSTKRSEKEEEKN